MKRRHRQILLLAIVLGLLASAIHGCSADQLIDTGAKMASGQPVTVKLPTTGPTSQPSEVSIPTNWIPYGGGVITGLILVGIGSAMKGKKQAKA